MDYLDDTTIADNGSEPDFDSLNDDEPDLFTNEEGYQGVEDKVGRGIDFMVPNFSPGDTYNRSTFTMFKRIRKHAAKSRRPVPIALITPFPCGYRAIYEYKDRRYVICDLDFKRRGKNTWCLVYMSDIVLPLYYKHSSYYDC